MSSEKREPSIVTHDREPVWGTAISSVANALIDSDRVTAHDYSEDSNWVAERTSRTYQGLQSEADPLVVPVST